MISRIAEECARVQDLLDGYQSLYLEVPVGFELTRQWAGLTAPTLFGCRVFVDRTLPEDTVMLTTPSPLLKIQEQETTLLRPKIELHSEEVDFLLAQFVRRFAVAYALPGPHVEYIRAVTSATPHAITTAVVSLDRLVSVGAGRFDWMNQGRTGFFPSRRGLQSAMAYGLLRMKPEHWKVETGDPK
jgi:hypothetical protein